MAYIPIALEMYSVRKEFTENPLATMKAVKAMGYEGVEFAGDPQFTPEFYAGLLKETGLVCCGWHTPWARVQPDKLADTIRLNQAVGNKYIIIPWLKAESHQDWLTKAAEMNALADKLAPYGFRCGYHNHAHEFQPLDGKAPWDSYMGNTYKRVVMQLDTGNALSGGADIMGTLNKYPGRCQTIHLKPSVKTRATPNGILSNTNARRFLRWKRLRNASRPPRPYVAEPLPNFLDSTVLRRCRSPNRTGAVH